MLNCFFTIINRDTHEITLVFTGERTSQSEPKGISNSQKLPEILPSICECTYKPPLYVHIRLAGNWSNRKLTKDEPRGEGGLSLR